MKIKQAQNKKEHPIHAMDITVTAVMAALVFLGTYLFKLPTVSGYIHLGDSMILLTVALFGTRKGMAAGAIGAALSDLAGGFVFWAGPTVVIKSVWALLMGVIMHRMQKGKKGAFLAGALPGGIVQLGAYTLLRVFFYGTGVAVVEIPGLALQTGAGIAIGLLLYRILVRSGAAARLSGMIRENG